APADAEAASHKLLVRGGFIRQVGAGLWTYLPLGWRVHQKVVQIIREEMDAIGSQEMLCPVLTPAELWETSGRIVIPELFRLQDRAGRPYVLGFTHEETMTFHARELQSYKQLPQAWYHFSTKERDEPRPRAGLLRVRGLRRRHRGRARSAAAAEVPGVIGRARGGRNARRDDDRGARGLPRHRRGGDVEGDARRRRRTRRARARARGRPAERGEAD